MIFGACFCVLAVCGLVLYLNRDSFNLHSPSNSAVANESGLHNSGTNAPAYEGGVSASQMPTTGTAQNQNPAQSSEIAPENGLVAQDLDFWEMYPQKGETQEEEENPSDASLPAAEISEAETDPAKDGRHTLVVDPAGGEEWVLINPYYPKNSYDLTKFTAQNNLMRYYENGRTSSFVGVDLNEYNGEIDFEALKRYGIDYCMFRAGVRGYESGVILQDKLLEQNLQKAQEAGMRAGLYFSSQAINEEEAVEEALFCINFAQQYSLSYPIAYLLEDAIGATSRASVLRREERTLNTIAFCSTIEAAGFVPMVYGTKYYLLKQVDLSRLSGYEIWYSDTSDLPDYPYQFAMWQYSQTASIPGLSGLADLNISFVNYEER